MVDDLSPVPLGLDEARGLELPQVVDTAGLDIPIISEMPLTPVLLWQSSQKILSLVGSPRREKTPDACSKLARSETLSLTAPSLLCSGAAIPPQLSPMLSVMLIVS